MCAGSEPLVPRVRDMCVRVGLALGAGMFLQVAIAQPAAAPALPDAPGKELVIAHCTACHGMERVLNAGGTRRGWTERMQRMQRWGAKIPQRDIAPLAQFLAAALPPRVRMPTSSSLMLDTSLSTVALHPIQSIVRTAAERGTHGELLANLPNAMGRLVKVGQRARVFTPNTRLAFQQARVIRSREHDAEFEVAVSAIGAAAAGSRYVLEIVIEHGEFLSVPNEAIFEDGPQRVVYLRTAAGDYVPRAIRTGIAGERYTQVLTGLEPGNAVVTLGAFFVDAQYRMRAADP
jgi:hypothetical protein